jgi:protoporphyrinogen oxidase
LHVIAATTVTTVIAVVLTRIAVAEAAKGVLARATVVLVVAVRRQHQQLGALIPSLASTRTAAVAVPVTNATAAASFALGHKLSVLYMEYTGSTSATSKTTLQTMLYAQLSNVLVVLYTAILNIHTYIAVVTELMDTCVSVAICSDIASKLDDMRLAHSDRDLDRRQLRAQ